MVTLLICFVFAALCLAACALMVHNAINKINADIKKEENSRKAALREGFDAFFRTLREQEKEIEELRRQCSENEDRILDLENGVIPDFEQAKEAVRSVNDFNKGISAIMGYDPFEARRKSQEERGDNR